MIAALGAAVVLLALPAALARVGRRLAPSEWAWLCAAAVGGGVLVLEAVLLLRAAPGVLAAAGLDAFAAACSRALAPLLTGGAAVTWAAASAAVVLPAAAAVALHRGRRLRGRLAAELWLGERHDIAGSPVVVLPLGRPLAVSLDHAEALVVISQGLVDMLTGEELAAVVRHERAHLAHHHQRLQSIRTAVAPLLGRLPVVRRSLAVFDLAVERWADEASASGHEHRQVLRRSLLRVAGVAPVAGVTAFADASTVAARLEALASPPVTIGRTLHPLLYLPGIVLAAVAAPPVVERMQQTAAVAAMAGQCVV